MLFKTKKVFEYVSNFPGGPEECIKEHGKLSVTRVYDTSGVARAQPLPGHSMGTLRCE